VCIAANTRNALHREVKFFQTERAILVPLRQSGDFEEWDNETSKTAIDMHANAIRVCNGRKGGDWVLVPVGKIDT
jgi:hypothetical protein